jgi:diguanylate cyclase (GGDEF)-like protein
MSEPGRLEELSEEVQALNGLLDVAQLVVSSIEMDHVLYAILESALRLTKTKAGSIAFYDPCNQELQLRAHRGFSTDFEANMRWKVRPGGLTDKILKSNKPTVITDTANKEFFTNPLAIEEGIKSMVCVPLTLGETIVGIFYVDDFTPREFSDSELRLLYILSSFAAMSIDHAKKLENIKKLSVTDGLTGLYNHRHFQETLEREISRAERYGEQLSLLMIDIDDFKLVNDSLGHQFGDQVLVKLSECLRMSTRESDIPARYGGEEFVIILPNTDRENATVMAERVRNNFMKLTSKLCDEIPTVSLSVGSGSYPADSTDRETLISCADKALYAAKRSGKNRSVRYDELSGDNVG